MPQNLRSTLIVLISVAVGLMGLYEITAKSPRLLGMHLPGWGKTCRVERATPWRQPTRIHLVDKVLHEGQEALLFYGFREL